MNDLASRLRSVPEGDLSIAVGASALGIGTILAFDRMDASWAAFPLLLLVAVPCAFLFWLALAPGGGTRPDGRLAPWQTACLLIALPLLAGSFIQLTEVLGKESPGTGVATWVQALIGLVALWLSVTYKSPGATLLACLFFASAGLTAVNWIDSDAPTAAYRDVLLIEGLLFLLAARSVWEARRADANLLVGVGGVALIAGAILGNVGNPLAVVLPSPLGGETESASKEGWELVLVLVSIGLLAYAAWQRHGGTAFVGAGGTVAFLGFASGGDLAGWPLILGLVTLACLAWALRPGRSAAGGAPPQTSQPKPQPPPT